jgi:defect-in-organelle-trafficking protein DotD
MRRSMVGVLGIVLLAACVETPAIPPTVAVPGMPNAEEALRLSMAHVDAQMAKLGGITPPHVIAAEPVMPAELMRKVDFRFAGTLDKAVRQLARTLGYGVYIDAPPDGEYLTVSIAAEDSQIGDILRALGDQMGSRATVDVDAVHHAIRVTHHV